MPAVLVKDPNAMQNSSFLSPVLTETVASTHCTNPQTDDQAEWAWVIPGWQTHQRSPIPVLTGFDVA